MKKKPEFFVGRVGDGRPGRVFRTMEEAEAEISRIAETDPQGVLRGDYYLDAPETSDPPAGSGGGSVDGHTIQSKIRALPTQSGV